MMPVGKSSSKSAQTVQVVIESPVGAEVRHASFDLKIDDSAFKVNVSKNGRAYYASEKSTWVTNHLPRPESKRGLDQIKRPLGNLIVFPSVDPVTPKQRALYKTLMEEQSWIQRANVIIQKLVVTKYTTEAEPRAEAELTEEAVKKWREEKSIPVPYWNNKKCSPKEIKQFVDRLFLKLKAPKVFFDAYLIQRAQGRCAIGMFPELRDDNGKYVLPQALRYIEPEYTRRPVLNFDTGDLAAVEIVGLTSNGGRLDANRCIYITNSENLNLFGRYYGRSNVAPVADIGKTLMIIYSNDFPHAAEFTWHKPNIYRLTIPARDFDKFETILKKFNDKLANNAGKDVSVTNAVELLNPGAGSNTGNITGLIQIENSGVEAIGGYYNIPPFMFSKGKAGNLGGNANREEIDAFLETEVKPEQEILERTIETQGYDRILAILFMVEPEEVDNPEKVPLKLRHYFDKPEIAATVNLEQYEIAKDMRDEGLIRTEDLMEKFNIRSNVKDDTMDDENVLRTWQPKNRSWNTNALPKDHPMKNWKPNRIQVNNRSPWPGLDMAKPSRGKQPVSTDGQ